VNQLNYVDGDIGIYT